MLYVTYDAVIYRKRRAEAFNFVLSIKSYGYFYDKSALLFSVNLHYQNYFGWNKDAIDLFYTYFIVPKVSVNYIKFK